MAKTDPWTELGARIRRRRESLGYSTYQADKAGGPAPSTWQRVERGETIDASSLYLMCTTLLLERDEAREWFDLVGLDFDAAGYKTPEALAQLKSALGKIKRGAEEALAAAARIEAESRRAQ